MSENSAGSADVQRPALRVVRGEPTAEELAVVTALVTALAGGASGGDEPAVPPAPPPLRGRWNDQCAPNRRPWVSGPGAWRASAR